MNITLKRGLLAAACTAGAATIPAYAQTLMQWAPVIRVTPVFSSVSQPREQCWTERVTRNEYLDQRGVPLSALVDGITGNVVYGAPAGAADTTNSVSGPEVANSIDLDRAGVTVAPVTRDIERCRVVDAGRDVIAGYDVTYRYQNRDFTTRMAYDPGERVRVRVDVAPAAQ